MRQNFRANFSMEQVPGSTEEETGLYIRHLGQQEVTAS